MNFSPTTTEASIPRLALQSVTTLVGVAIAALLAFTIAEGGSSKEPRATSSLQPATTVVDTSGHQSPHVVYYMVNSTSQADFAAFLEDYASRTREGLGVPELNWTVQVLFLSTPQQELAIMEHLSAASYDLDSGVLMEIIDLRGRP